MLRLIADENFNGDIIRGVLLRRPDFDLVRVQDVGLAGASDPDILAWAADQNRIVISHDLATMANAAFDRRLNELAMPGLFLLPDQFPVGEAISELLLIDDCSDHLEWNGFVAYLPL